MVAAVNDPGKPSPVLAAVDFSNHSRRSLIYAARLAQVLERPLVVLHVVHEDAGAVGAYREDRAGAGILPRDVVARRRLDDFVEKLKAAHPELTALESAQYGVVRGIPGSRIVEMSELCNASLVVVGSRGLQGFASWWQGSISQSVVKGCRCSVVVARDHGSPDNRMAAASIGRRVSPLPRDREPRQALSRAAA